MSDNFTTVDNSILKQLDYSRTGSSVDWASGYHAGGREFDSRRTNAQGLKNNWGESAAFVITSANG